MSWTAGSWLQARLVPHQGRRFLVTTGLLLLALGLAGIASVLIPGVSLLVALVAWGVAWLGMGLAYSTLSLVVLETTPADQEGYASASLQLSSVLGSAFEKDSLTLLKLMWTEFFSFDRFEVANLNHTGLRHAYGQRHCMDALSFLEEEEWRIHVCSGVRSLGDVCNISKLDLLTFGFYCFSFSQL